MGSWFRAITTPFRKACTGLFFNSPKDKQLHPQTGYQEHEDRSLKLHGEVMACTYEDVRVMWSILDKSRSEDHMISS